MESSHSPNVSKILRRFNEAIMRLEPRVEALGNHPTLFGSRWYLERALMRQRDNDDELEEDIEDMEDMEYMENIEESELKSKSLPPSFKTNEGSNESSDSSEEPNKNVLSMSDSSSYSKDIRKKRRRFKRRNTVD